MATHTLHSHVFARQPVLCLVMIKNHFLPGIHCVAAFTIGRLDESELIVMLVFMAIEAFDDIRANVFDAGRITRLSSRVASAARNRHMGVCQGILRLRMEFHRERRW
jgi:hypothetical protein